MVEPEFSFKFKLPNTGFHLSGYSKNKSGTGLFIDELSLGLDCGTLKSERIPRHIFLTRNDIELFLYAPMLIHRAELLRGKYGVDKIVFHVPEAYSKLLEKVITKALALGSLEDRPVDICEWMVHPVSHGSTIYIDRTYFAQAFETAKFSVGYAFYGYCHRLKNQYTGYGFRDTQGRELEDITEKITYPLFVYTGAVTPVVFGSPEVASFLKPFKNIIIECPYIEKKNAGFGKTSLEELLPFIESSPDTIFILTRLEYGKSYEELKRIQLDSPANVLFAMSQEYNTNPHKR